MLHGTSYASIALAITMATAPLAISPASAQKSKQAKPTAEAKKTKVSRKQAQAMLRVGYDALQGGKTKDAIAKFSEALDTGRLGRNDVARALYYRGRAYRKAKLPAKAISDLTSALWLKGALNKTEREAAIKERQAAYSDAGVAVASVSPVAGSAQRTTTLSTAKDSGAQADSGGQARSPNAGKSWQTASRPAAPAPRSTGSTQPAANTGQAGSFTSFFGNLFGTSLSPQPEAPSPSKAQTTTGWQTGLKPSSAGPKPRRVARKSPRKTAPKGRYAVQVASFRDPAKAQALARKILTKYGPILRNRKPIVEGQDVGNMGRFYHVRIRNWQSAKATSGLCKKLLGSGLDCLVTKSN